MSAEWFGRRLRELRESTGMNRVELAKKAGLSEGGVRDLEQGHRHPSWETVLKLAGALGVSCEAFCQAPAGGAPVKRPRGRPRKAGDDQGGEVS
jgi:transcriptional regulator with XRE-family HTH domain